MRSRSGRPGGHPEADLSQGPRLDAASGPRPNHDRRECYSHRTIDSPAIDLPAIDLPAIDLPDIELLAVDLPAIDLPVID